MIPKVASLWIRSCDQMKYGCELTLLSPPCKRRHQPTRHYTAEREIISAWVWKGGIFYRSARHMRVGNVALYVAPLCPAGHLPRKGGDQSSSMAAFNSATLTIWRKRTCQPISPLAGEMSGRTEGGVPDTTFTLSLQLQSAYSISPRSRSISRRSRLVGRPLPGSRTGGSSTAGSSRGAGCGDMSS